MARVQRVLDLVPVDGLTGYLDVGGGKALELAAAAPPLGVIEAIEASGLRGRGGGGFPTGTKWRTVAENASDVNPTTVVVNAAEGEPGTYKDRAILAANPYRVLEGALVAAKVVGADRVVVAIKASETAIHDRLLRAVAEVESAGWTEGVEVVVATGPEEYLYGEETALLEVLDGRAPFPRLSPPYRRGVDEPLGSDGTAAGAELASSAGATEAAPTLVNNVETYANVPGIVVEGPEWFRSVGTEGSPGTIVCTVSGDCPTEGVAEYAMGTPLSEVLADLGGMGDPATEVGFVLSGVSNPLFPVDRIHTPLDYEAMAEAGGGLGTGGFLVFGPDRDPVAVTAGVSRFLGVESCGQCTPCKQDGLALSVLLEGLRAGAPEPDAAVKIADRARSVSVEARLLSGHPARDGGHQPARTVPGIGEGRGRSEPEPRTSARRPHCRHQALRREALHPRRTPRRQTARLDLRRRRLRSGTGRPHRPTRPRILTLMWPKRSLKSGNSPDFTTGRATSTRAGSVVGGSAGALEVGPALLRLEPAELGAPGGRRGASGAFDPEGLGQLGP